MFNNNLILDLPYFRRDPTPILDGGGGGGKKGPQVDSAIWCLTTMKLGRNTV